MDIIPNYNGQIFITKIDNANSILYGVNNVACEKIVLKNISIDYVEDVLDFDIIEEVLVSENIVLYNCYTHKLDRKVVSNNGVFNIQIAVENEIISIGYPYLIDY